MAKGIEITDLTVGTGDEATKESIVAANVRIFLRRGDEVGPSPLYGTRHVIDLGRRESIAGLRYGIPGMRVGGTRKIVISPHLAYGEDGVPGMIPANALLRCEVELRDIRKRSGLLPQDWLPGKILLSHRCRDAEDHRLAWRISLHERGNSRLTLHLTIPHEQREKRERWSQIPIQLEAAEAEKWIREAIDLPNQIPEDCVEWSSDFIKTQAGGTAIWDRRNGVRCMFLQVMESGKSVLINGVHEASSTFRDSAFNRTIERLISPHLQTLSDPP